MMCWNQLTPLERAKCAYLFSLFLLSDVSFEHEIAMVEIHNGNGQVQQVKVVCLCLCLVAHLWPTLCNPLDCSLPGSSVHGIFQARILEWVAIFFSKGSSLPRNQTHVSCIAGSFLHFRRILYLLSHL